MRWVGYVASQTQNRTPTVLKRKNMKKTVNLEDLDVNGRIMSKWVVKK